MGELAAPVAGVAAIELERLTYAYRKGKPVLDLTPLTVAAGERVFLHGPSGSGKTTLLGILAGILTPQGGVVRVLGQDLGALSGNQRDFFRGAHLGYIFQMFNLIPYLNVRENITLPCKLSAVRKARLGGVSEADAAAALARQLDIHPLLEQPVTQLSVGQQQRVAAARALIGAPRLIIADEPTSALDNDHRHEFLQLLFAATATAGASVLFVSHDLTLASLFSRTVALPELNRVKLSARGAL